MDRPIRHLTLVLLAGSAEYPMVDVQNVPVSGDASRAIVRAVVKEPAPEQAVRAAVEKGWMAVDHRNWFHAGLPFWWADLREAKLPSPLRGRAGKAGPVAKGDSAARLGL
jgi:hypothetical protein